MRAAVGEELVCLEGNAERVLDMESASVESSVGVCALQRIAQGAVAEKGSVVDCPGAAVSGENEDEGRAGSSRFAVKG